MANKTLVVVSNHPVDKWDDTQLQGWDDISYIPHPIIPATMTGVEIDKLVIEVMDKIMLAIDLTNVSNTYFCIQGDYSFVFRLWKEIEYSLCVNDEQFVFPTTDRKVVETIKDGVTVKETIFKFVQWR